MTEPSDKPLRVNGMRVLRRTVILIALGTVLNSMVSVGLWYKTDQGAKDRCRKIHLVVTSGARVIDSRARLAAFLKTGAITREQYEQALREADRNFEGLVGRRLPP